MNKKESHGIVHIMQSLIVNILIASSKGFAAFMTGSGAMLAETIHSFSDCANQALLLVGVKQAQRPANDKHPLGFGREVELAGMLNSVSLLALTEPWVAETTPLVPPHCHAGWLAVRG